MPRRFLCALLVAVAVLAAAGATQPASTAFAAEPLDRPADPVVLTGADLPSLAGIDPADLVAFRYSGGWQQVPVQVDERDIKYFWDIYQNSQPWPGLPIGDVSELVYVDSGTFTGPDSDPTLDADDEIVFMAKDADGPALTLASPAGIMAGTAVEVSISDPLDSAAHGYVYLFQSDGTLDPGAGQQYVSYTFDLLSGDYLDTYDTLDGPNPEDSTATTPYYSDHFSDRWVNDEMHVTAGAASGVDILDRHKSLFAPGVCTRSEDTFSDGEGAFIVNKSGPVRALRSYVGANSGPLTQRENIFYERRQDIRTYLRVHSISGIMDFFDYSPAASGMTYYNDLNPAGVTIDGNPESITLGALEWEMATGDQGTLVMAGSLETNIPDLEPTSYYLDDSTPSVTQCTGDDFAYGSSGTRIAQTIPCTEPALLCSYFFRGVRTIYYDSPALSVEEAETLNEQAKTPLTYTVGAFPASPVGGIAEYPADEPSAALGESHRRALGDAVAWGALAGGLVIAVSAACLATRRRPTG